MRILIPCCLILSVALLTGCGTLYSRRGHVIEPGPYPATRLDTHRMFNSSQHDFSPLIDIVGFSFWLIDLPISLVTDTIMLPHDIETTGTSNKTQEGIGEELAKPSE